VLRHATAPQNHPFGNSIGTYPTGRRRCQDNQDSLHVLLPTSAELGIRRQFTHFASKMVRPPAQNVPAGAALRRKDSGLRVKIRCIGKKRPENQPKPTNRTGLVETYYIDDDDYQDQGTNSYFTVLLTFDTTNER